MPKDAVTGPSIEEIAEAVGSYDVAAYFFVQDGLTVTARRVHGKSKSTRKHVTGQELAKGLRDLAIRRWGLLARTVLNRWGIYTTLDFGKIVYAMIDAGMMNKTEDDSLEDFRNVYDFRKAFEVGYVFGKVQI